MKIQLNSTNNVAERIPNYYIYNIIFTLIIAFAIVWIIYSSVPYSHYSVYLIESDK